MMTNCFSSSVFLLQYFIQKKAKRDCKLYCISRVLSQKRSTQYANVQYQELGSTCQCHKQYTNTDSTFAVKKLPLLCLKLGFGITYRLAKCQFFTRLKISVPNFTPKIRKSQLISFDDKTCYNSMLKCARFGLI